VGGGHPEVDFMRQFRNSRERLRVRAAWLLGAAAASILTGGALAPTISAQSNGTPQFLTWQLNVQSEDAQNREPVVTRRRIAPRAALRRSLLRDAAAEAEAAATPIDVSDAVTLLQSYTGANLGDTGALPPDPSGGAGPTQFIIAATGRIRTISKATGTPDGVLNTTTDTFFTSVRNGASTFAPKVKYDRLAGRWFIIAGTDAAIGRIVIASSNASTITASTVWSFFAFDNSYPAATCAVDSPTLAIDNAALYIGVVQFCDGGVNYAGTTGYVVRKTSVINSATIALTAFHGLTGNAAGQGLFAPHGVDNDDPGSGTGYFIGVDNASFGTLMLRRVANPGTTPTISGNIAIAVAPTALPITVRHLGNTGGTNGFLDGGDDRLTSATLRGGTIWTSQTIGVLDNGQASASANRNGVRWYQIGSPSATPTVLQSGTLFTSGAPGSFNEQHYWVPSIDASTRGRTVVGFSTAGTSQYANAGVAERFDGDAVNTLRAPQLITAANDAYNPPGDPGSASRGRRWGGGSVTVMDGCDGSTIWTVQQFTDAVNSYGLQVGRTVGPPPATPVSVAPSVLASGIASVDLIVTASSSAGSEFFDPGAGWLCHLGASIPGVTVNSVAYLSPTTARVNVSTVNSIPGLKPITMVNPDGRTATGAPMLRVQPGQYITIDLPQPGAAPQPVVVRGWAVDGTAASGTGVDAVHIYAGSTFLGAATYGLARPDVGADHGSRFTNSGYSFTAAGSLPPGAYTITAYGHSTVTGNFTMATSVNVTLAAPAPPIGAVDTPANGVTARGEIAVTGWALDDSAIASVDVYRSPVGAENPNVLVFIGRAVFIRGARPDVQAAYPNMPDNDNAGWGFMVLTNMLPGQGNGTFDLHAIATDQSGLTTLLGTRRIVAANAGSTRPFGTIDTPAQGATVSGTIINFGWALAPTPRQIPIDGTTIDVYVDGVFRGHPVYNNVRPDIATLFPGLYNTTGGRGAIGYFMLDTTTLSNGLHTIHWVIRDDIGQASGVGSRFFRVQN
jgi:hypothetical protein